jgi:hypothetical protein
VEFQKGFFTALLKIMGLDVILMQLFDPLPERIAACIADFFCK